MTRAPETETEGVSALVVISGPGHHERAERARPVIGAVSALGVDVVVRTDLRPRLADDIRGLLQAGAARVRLEADGLAGELIATDAEATGSPGGSDPMAGGPETATVMIVLRAGPASPPEVRGEGEVADSVRASLDALSEVAPNAGSDHTDPDARGNH